MFEDDDDFEIDEEFLDGVFDAERSATICDETLSTSCISPKVGFDLEPSPSKKRRSFECTSPSSVPEVSKRRTSEESARLVAFATHKSAESGNNSTSNVCSQSGNSCNRPSSDIFKPPFVPSPKNQPFVRCSTSSNIGSEVSFTLSTSRVRQRKFPGPAGLLPERDRSHMQGQRPNFSSLLNSSGSDLEETEEPISFCSQSTASVLEDGPWAALQSDLSGEGQALLRQYTVSWVKQKAAARQLVGQKVPFLAAVLQSIDCSSPDPCVVLRDATGEIPGTLHRSVWDSFGGQLIAGSALVLRLVGVLSTGISARRHYLNITSNNIVTIYSSPLCESSISSTSNRVKKTDVHKWTISQLLQAANNWEDQSKKKKDVNLTPTTANTFSNNRVTPSNVLDRSGGTRPLLQTSNSVTSSPNTPATSNRGSTFSYMPPAQQPSRGNFSPCSQNANSNSASNTASFRRPPVTALNVNPAHRTNSPLVSQNTLQPPSTSKSTISSSTPQSKFVPKRPSFPAGGILLSNNYNQLTPQRASSNISHGNVNISQASSKDMFSDDDFDVSSVLDGIDSESLFGDF